MKLSLEQVKASTIDVIGSGDLSQKVTVFTDTRKSVENGLFIPIVGERFDAHSFLETAVNAGAKAALWQSDHPIPKSLPDNFLLFTVKDTLSSLQDLAKIALQQVSPKVVGVTGSNGKTTTKDIIGSLLSVKYNTHMTKGNFNNHIGLPLTILAMPEECEVLVLEMGMNHFGEISLLSKIAEPNLAVITNIGESHIEFLGSREGIAKAKCEITDGMKKESVLVIDGDEPLLKREYPSGLKVVSCGIHDDNTQKITDIKPSDGGYVFKLNKMKESYHIPLIGMHNVKNASYGIAVAETLGMTPHEIQTGFDKLLMTGMRLETVTGKAETLLINDSYNASPTSMMAAIETVKQLPEKNKRVLVLGNMYELGSQEESLHRQVATVIQPPVSHVIVIGDKAKWIGEEMRHTNNPIQLEIFDNKEMALPRLESLLGPGTVMLFKASRRAALETLVEALKQTK